MVSPSKKRKLEAKGKASNTTVRGAAVTGDCRLLKSHKPLADKKFYLDFKNHGVAVKIEARLKSLGASVEVFLAKEVNYAVTDRPEWSSNNSGSRPQKLLTSQWLASPMQTSASPSTFDSPAETFAGTRRLLQRSRAVAMLEKAKQQHTHLNTIDPLENAVRWGVPIWPVDKVLKWLDKIEQSLNSNLSTLSIKTKCLKTPYVKLEALSKKYRPVYSSFDKWPTINLDCIDTCSPFTVPKPPANKDSKSARHVPQQAMLEGPQSDQRMTRKTRVTLVRNEEPEKAKLNPGFCEVCDTDFNDIEQHLNSSTHLKFVHDSTNYQDLDTLIKEGPSVEELLKAIDPIGCATRRSPRGTASPPWLSSDSVTDTCDIADIMRRPTLINGQLRRTSQRQADERSKAAARKETSETFMNGISKKCKIPFNDLRSTDEDRNSGEFSHNLRSRLAPIDEAGYKRLRSRNSEGSASAEGSSDSRDSSKLDGCSDGEAAHCSTRSRTGLARTRGTRNSSSGSDSKRDHDGHAADDAVNGKGCCSEDDTCCTLPGSKCSRMKGKPIKKKRLSVEEKLLEDNKEYFKLEVINAKLRSSGYFCNQRESTMGEDMHAASQGNNDDSDVDTGGHKDETLVKTRRPPRPRRSELSLLNDEADSYLFGDKSVKKEVQSPTYQNAHRSPLQVHIYADECANHVPSAPLGEQALLPSIKEEVTSPHQDDACHSGSNGSPLDGERKKRRTHAEVFIHDNFDYYKFQLPESRLRLHNSSNPHSPEKTESEEGGSPKFTAPPSGSRAASSVGNIPESKTKYEDIAPPELSNFPFVLANTPESVERMRFSFESIPRSEPWFQTYQRQDDGEEMLEPYSDFIYEKRVKLPYEMSSDLFLSKLIRGKGVRGRGRGRLKLLPHRSRAMQLAAAARNPRKSPRCHASTLAILSSFMNKRRRHSVGVVSDGACPPTLATIPECAPDFQEIEKRIDEMLASPPSSPTADSSVKPLGRVRRRSQRRAVEGSKDSLDVVEQEPTLEAESMDADNPVSNVGEVGLKTSSEVDVVNLLDEFPKCSCVEELKTDDEPDDDDESCNPLAQFRLDLNSECGSYDTMSETGTNYSSAKGKLKKRKTNRTGWPAKRKQKKREPDFNDKKKKLEVEPTKDFVGVRIKRLPITSCGEVHMVYRTTSCRGRGRRGATSSRASVPVSRSSRTHSESRGESTPVKSPHSGNRVGSSKETQDDSRSPRSSTSIFSSPRVRETSRKNQTRTKAKWGSTSLRHRR